MSLSSISSQLPRTVEQTQSMEHHLRAGPTDSNSTIVKIAAIFFGVIIAKAAFAFGGTLIGLVTLTLCGVVLIRLFQRSVNSGLRFLSGNFPPNHQHGPGRGGHPGPYAPGHVVVGGGHMHPPGPGHIPRGGHVGVGGGHGHAPAGHPPHQPHAPGHVPVGRGHGPGLTGAPPPAGPGGHVPVGRRG